MVLSDILKYSPIELFIALGVILALVEWLTVVCGRRFSLGPKVCERSSHEKFTPTCGGIVWIIAAVAGILLFGNLSLSSTWIFLGGVVFLGAVSMVDDLRTLPPIPRLIAQTIVMALTFKQLCYPEVFDIYIIVLFCGVGIINAINFLDGISGMLALYGLVVSGSIMYSLYLANVPTLEWLMPVLAMVIVAQIVFACFNFKDIIFAGDTGSITLGYIQVVITILLILATRDASMMIFFMVCIADTGLTTLHRLFFGESILEPHRMNIYQVLTSKNGVPHLVVSLVYALLQLLINALYFLIPESQHWTYFLIVCGLLIVVYFAARFSFATINRNNSVN